MHTNTLKFVLLAAVIGLPLSGNADVIKLNTHDNGQSVFLAEHAPGVVQNSINEVSVRRRSNAGSERNNIGAFKFDLPVTMTPNVIAANLSFAVYREVALSTEILVYGLNTDASKGPVTAKNWSETTVTYNSMPGLLEADGNLQNPSINPADTVFLGNIVVPGGLVAMSPISLSTQALIDYINSSVGSSVTFLLEIRLIGSTGRDEEVQLLSGQRPSPGAGFYPTLEMTTSQIPEAGHTAGIVLLAAIGYVAARRRARNRRCD